MLSLLCAAILSGIIDRCARADSPALFTQFDSDNWQKQWTLEVSGNTEIARRDNALWFSGSARAFANLRRALQGENLRITCELRSGNSSHWTPSIFIYWDASNWYQAGFRPGPLVESSLFCAVMDDGQLDEAWDALNRDHGAFWHYDPARCMLQPNPAEQLNKTAAWRHVGVDITPKWIYFLSSEDGKTWARYRRLLRRNLLSQAPPRSLIIGKGFADPNSGLVRDFLCNDDPTDRGSREDAGIRNIRISSLPVESQKETLPESFDARDNPGDAVLRQNGDPSFDAVNAAFPPLRYSRELIGVRDHPDDFAITPEAAIHFIDGYYAFEIGDPPVRFGRDGNAPRVAKRLLHGYIPIVFSEWRRHGVQFEQCAFAISRNFSPDQPIEAYVRLTLTNKDDHPQTVEVALRQFHADGTCAGDTKAVATWRVSLSPAEQRIIHVTLPHGFAKSVEQPLTADFNSKLESVEEYWTTLLNQGTTIDVPEARLRNAYRAWLAYNYLNVQKINGACEPHDGSGFYSMVYGISASLYCRALDEYGRHDDAQRYLESLLKFVKPDGSFIVNYGLPDIGALLLALDDHYQMTRDRDWLIKVLPEMRKMSNWIIERRHADMTAQPHDAICHGLIFEKPYCDYPQKAYNFASDLHLAAGLYAAVASFEAAGMSDESTRVRREADAYRGDILIAMKRSAIEIDGSTVIPIFPKTHALLKASSYTAQDYYSLMAGQVLEKGLLDPNGWEAKSIIHMIESHGGLTMGVCRFWGGIDHAYTYGYLFNCLQRGEAHKVLLGLYSSMAFGMSRDTYSAVEISQVRTGSNQGTLPHLYSNTQQLRLLRAMLIYEDGNDLHLCRAIPTAWLEDGKSINIRHAATQFGELSFEITSNLANDVLNATIQPPTLRMPDAIQLRLRHPAGMRIQSAKINGNDAEIVGDTIILRHLRSPTTLRVEFE